MERRPFGSTNRQVPVMGPGTWYGGGDGPAAPRSPRCAGARSGDDPHRYGGNVRVGAAEERVGEAIGGRREEVFLVSKVLPQHASRRGTVAACEPSLATAGDGSPGLLSADWRGATGWRTRSRPLSN